MAVDASIPLGIRPIQVADPMERYSNALAIQGQQQANALRAMQAQQAQEERTLSQQRRAGLNAILTGGSQGEDLERALMRGGYLDESLKVGKDRREMRKSEAAAKKDEIEATIKRGDRIIQAFGSARDQASWTQALQVFALTEGPEEAARMPQQFDPGVQQAMLQRMIPELERMKMAQAKAIADQQSATARRGQDISASTARRGQDMTDAREREMPRGVPLETAEGPVLVNPRDGTARPVTMPGGGRVPPKPEKTTGDERTAAGYLSRMQAAEKLLAEAPQGEPTVMTQAAGAVPMVGGYAQRKLSTPEQQRYKQAADDWIRAKLRKESGAVIAASEMQQEYETYFPQPGDSVEVRKQKAAARKEAERQMEIASGPAAKLTSGAQPARPAPPALPQGWKIERVE